MALSYLQLLQRLHALPAGQKQVESFLRLFFQEDQIGSDQWDMALKALTADSVAFNLEATPTFDQGVVGWDTENHTYTFGVEFGTKLQLGMETVRYVHNETGSDIPDGTAVFLSSISADGHQTVELVDTSTSARVAGVTTSTILKEGTGVNAHGFITKDGVVRDIDITGLTEGLPIYADPTTPGGMTNTRPSWPDFIIFLGSVIKDNGDDTGDIDVDPLIIQRDVPTPVCLATYSAVPERNALENIHGGLALMVSGHDLSAGDLTLTGATAQGVGKIVIVINTASDFDGEITVTGTVVDRDTGAETASQTDTLTIDALSTDNSGVDANGIEVHDIVGGYITDPWFDGSAEDVVISSSDTTITDIDVYQCSFEQFNDAEVLIIKSLDLNLLCTTASAAQLSAYLYKVIVLGDKVTIQTIASVVKSDFVTDRYYRLRRGAIDLLMNGKMDGIFVEQAYLGTPSKFADASLKVWAEVIL